MCAVSVRALVVAEAVVAALAPTMRLILLLELPHQPAASPLRWYLPTAPERQSQVDHQGLERPLVVRQHQRVIRVRALGSE